MKKIICIVSGMVIIIAAVLIIILNKKKDPGPVADYSPKTVLATLDEVDGNSITATVLNDYEDYKTGDIIKGVVGNKISDSIEIGMKVIISYHSAPEIGQLMDIISVGELPVTAK